jgi:hypothetical protein
MFAARGASQQRDQATHLGEPKRVMAAEAAQVKHHVRQDQASYVQATGAANT